MVIWGKSNAYFIPMLETPVLHRAPNAENHTIINLLNKVVPSYPWLRFLVAGQGSLVSLAMRDCHQLLAGVGLIFFICSSH